jgi:hypothetical protein
MIYLQNQPSKAGRHLLSRSFKEQGQRKKIMDDHDKLYSEIEISQLLSNDRLFQHRCKFQKYIIDVYTISQQLFQRKDFLFSLSEQFKNSGMCISTAKTSKHKGEIKTHQRKKIKLESNEIQTTKTKNKYAQKVHLKTSCNKFLGKLKSRKILFDGKAVLLMVPWVRVDSDSFISLLSI